MRAMTRWKYGDRLGLEHAVDQLVHDDPVDLVALRRGRTHVLEPARRQLLRIDLAVDQPARAGDAEAPEAARRRLPPPPPRRCAATAAASAAAT